MLRWSLQAGFMLGLCWSRGWHGGRWWLVLGNASEQVYGTCWLWPHGQCGCTDGTLIGRRGTVCIPQGGSQSHTLGILVLCESCLSFAVSVGARHVRKIPVCLGWFLLAGALRPRAQHLERVVSRVRSFSFSSASTASPSASPAMIWSRMFFWVHSLLQKLQVFASSLRETTKSSNVTPSCCTRDVKTRCSTDLLICLLTYVSMALKISSAFSLIVG